MSNKYSLPYDIRMECIAYVRGYPRRVRAYNAAREEVLEASSFAMSGMPHSPGNSRIAERKAERLATIENWPETKKMRDIANENVRRKLVWVIMRNCENRDRYPLRIMDGCGFSERTMKRRKAAFLWHVADYLGLVS